MKIAMTVAALALLWLGPAAAAEVDGVDCAHAEAQNDMNICADRDFKKADAVLNKTYKDTLKGMDAHTTDLLRKAQRAWVAFRDAECSYENAENEGGSIYPMVYSGCLTRLSKLRTQQLKQGNSE
ncbi:MAG TPA: lysozyme inhibitor LprI family protein [Rhizomicrobium sp.]|nr:lysozyme inhibitor LprI family protein [Rhizomicrobium sp.]